MQAVVPITSAAPIERIDLNGLQGKWVDVTQFDWQTSAIRCICAGKEIERNVWVDPTSGELAGVEFMIFRQGGQYCKCCFPSGNERLPTRYLAGRAGNTLLWMSPSEHRQETYESERSGTIASFIHPASNPDRNATKDMLGYGKLLQWKVTGMSATEMLYDITFRSPFLVSTPCGSGSYTLQRTGDAIPTVPLEVNGWKEGQTSARADFILQCLEAKQLGMPMPAMPYEIQADIMKRY